MKLVKDMPKDGQFVAVWEYQKNVWSGIYRWTDGELYEYSNSDDEFDITYGGVNRTAWGL